MRYAAFASLAVLALPALAQDATPPSDVPVVNSKEDFLALNRKEKWRYSRANRDPVSFFVDGEAWWSSAADLDNSPGDVSVTRLLAGGGVAFRVTDTADFILRGNARFSFYDFSNAAGVVPSLPALADPFDDVYEVTFDPIFRVLPEHGWQWFIGGRVRSAGEPDADFGDTIIGGGIAGASYDITDNFRLGVAINVNSRLEGGVWVFPIPIVEWDITDDITLRTLEEGVSLEYWFANSWNVSLRAGYDRYEYRLAKAHAISGGSVTDSRIPIAVALTYNPSDRVIITGRVGSEVSGSMDFNNSNGDEIASTDLGANFLVGFNVRIAF
ncbi:MAG: hypothetical protein H6810_04610 [Phycisphaeraceae bacterium]|nr:MAG: hypothetical protein H6810_04610 [Phycisphaeraceae bacterium]